MGYTPTKKTRPEVIEHLATYSYKILPSISKDASSLLNDRYNMTLSEFIRNSIEDFVTTEKGK